MKDQEQKRGVSIRVDKALAALGAFAIAGGALTLPTALAHADEPAAGEGNCIPLFPDNPLMKEPGANDWTDNNPNLYVGGDGQLLNHEGEGLVIVEGDLLVRVPSDYSWAYQLGAGAGGGSGSWPSARALMLAVGKNLNVEGNGLNIGKYEQPGTWYVGGSAAGSINYSQVWDPSAGEWGANVPLRVDSVAGTAADGYRAQLEDFQTEISSHAANGTVALRSSGAGLVLTGDGTSTLQVFELDFGTYGDQLVSHGASTIDLMGIPEDASIIIRAKGADSVQVTGAINYSLNGAPVEAPTGSWDHWGDGNLAQWGNLTQRLLWHFPTQTSVKIGLNNADHNQFTGSVFAGNRSGHLEAYASTNGRLISFGDFTAHQGGDDDAGRMEFHAFPFKYPGSLSCSANGVASFAMSKQVVDQAGNSLAEDPAFETTSYKVKVEWDDPLQGHQEAFVTLDASGEVVAGPSGIVIGDQVDVTFSEVGVINPPEGFVLKDAQFDVAGQTGMPLTVTVKDQDIAQLRLTNTYQVEDPGTGTFSLRKELTRPTGENLLEGETFTVRASWVEDGAAKTEDFELSGSGAALESSNRLPVGTVVSFEEVLMPETPEGWDFQGGTFSPETITITKNHTSAVVVTNTYVAKDDGPDVAVGGFNLSKTLCCPELGSLSEEFFTVRASWTIDDEDHFQDFQLKGDGTAVDGPQDLPAGTVVTFEETGMPATPEGWAFKEAVIDQQNLHVEAWENTAVSVRNTYARATGSFQVSKELVGASQGDFPEGTVFAVDATWTLPAAGEGGVTLPSIERLYVPADGTPVLSAYELPVGTLVTFSEVDVPVPAGWVFEGASFAPAQITIGQEQVSSVTATNTYTEEEPPEEPIDPDPEGGGGTPDPEPGPSPDPEPNPEPEPNPGPEPELPITGDDPAELPQTGASGTILLLAVGLGAVTLGALLLRRRSS